MKIVVNWQYEDPYLEVATPAELDDVLDQVHAESVEHGCGILGSITLPGKPSPHLDFGANKERGFVQFGSRNPKVTVISRGDEIDGTVSYWFQAGHESELPASAEITYDEVRKAVHEFLATGGQQPTNVTWQPFE